MNVLHKSSIRFLLFGLGFTAISHLYGHLLIQAIFPLYQLITTVLDSHIVVAHINIIQKYDQNFIQVDSVLSRQFFIGGHFFLLESTAPCSFLMAVDLVLQPVIMLYTLILAWPVLVYREYIVRLALGTLLLLILMALDLPLQIIYQHWVNVEKILHTTGNAEGFLLFWSNFSNGGGLIALSLTIGMISIGIAKRLQQYRNAVFQ